MDYELIWWCVMGVLALLGLVLMRLPWNDRYNRKGNDPYRYCPKEEKK